MQAADTERISDYRKTVYASYDRLVNHLPLEAPWSVMIEPSNKCNFKCIFCPTGDFVLLKKVGRPKGNMSLNFARKIIDDLTEFDDKIRLINFSKNGEPLLCNELPQMIEYAKSKKVAKKIMTVTNGALLDESMAADLLESGIDHIRVSVEHVSSSGYKEVTQNYDNYQLIVDNVANLFNQIEKKKSSTELYVKIVDIGLSDEEKKKFFEEFSPICHMINIENLRPWNKSEIKDFALGTEVKLNQKRNSETTDRKVCPAPFYSMNVNFNGEVSACAVDWCHGTIIGNVNDNSMMDIWQGPQLKEFRLKHLSFRKNEIDACRKCAYIRNFIDLSHLDDDATELKKLFG